MLRKSNFELLRIFAMFLIVAHHYSVYGEWEYPVGFEINKFYVQSLSVGGKLGVNLFVLISGYFLCRAQFKWDAVVNISSKTWFYSIFIVVVFFSFNVVSVSIKDIFKSLMPFGYWFVTAFICMLIMSPFINIMINNLNKKSHFRLIIAFSFLAVIPVLNNAIGNLSFFVYLYCIGAFLRKYYEHKSFPKKNILMIIAFNFIAIFSSIAILDYLSSFNALFDHPFYFIGMETPFILCLSVSIFLYFKQLSIGSFKIINTISSTMFGVYLIHDNFLVRPFLWRELFNNASYLNSDNLYFHSILSITVVFISCSFIDWALSNITRLLKIDTLKNKAIIKSNKYLKI
ncbi:acyltransferase [Vibrio sp. Vb1018]|uniref:acyltransferase n=1 Tax=Vibrio sp. Vb1018 TaxID=3074636 RepID=UPI002964DA56|nr:acyltransferase [Vibrio sp. Vb1018]MDW1821111.1 acyltransferase [Vibrio sp. Vb1018]